MSEYAGRNDGKNQQQNDRDFLFDVLRCESPPAPVSDDGGSRGGIESSRDDSSPIPGLSASEYAMPSDATDRRELVAAADQAQNKDSALDDFLLKTLDEMESRTEKLRETVKDAEEERLELLRSLNTLMQSEALGSVSEDKRQEMEIYMDRLIQRLLTIEISVQIVRSPSQEQSLQTVRTFLVKLRDCIRNDNADGETMINRYLNSCMEEANGPVDDRFQGALLGCAVEDQKGIRKKLGAIAKAKDDTETQMAIFASMDLEKS